MKALSLFSKVGGLEGPAAQHEQGDDSDKELCPGINSPLGQRGEDNQKRVADRITRSQIEVTILRIPLSLLRPFIWVECHGNKPDFERFTRDLARWSLSFPGWVSARQQWARASQAQRRADCSEPPGFLSRFER